MNKDDILSELYAIVGRVNELIDAIGAPENEADEPTNPIMYYNEGDFIIEHLERNPGRFRIASLEGDTLTVFCQEENLLALREFLVDPRSFADYFHLTDFGHLTEFPPRLGRNGEVVFEFETLLPLPNSQNIAINYTNITGDTHGFFKRIV